MNTKIALIGITGKKSGGAFARQILEHLDVIKKMFPGGIKVIARKASETQNIKALLPAVELCYLNEGQNSFFNILSDVDTVINIAGISISTEIAEAAAQNGVRRLILVHTTGVYSKYKAAGELYRKIDKAVCEICQSNGIVLTICRPTMIYGNIYDNNVVKFIKMVDRFPVMPVVKGARFKLQPVHYEDLAKAYYDILVNEDKTANKAYNLSGGAPIFLRDMLTTIGANLGKKVRFFSCPFWIAYSGAWMLYLVSFGKKDYREKVQRLCEDRTFSYEEARADFGYAPRTFEEGVTAEVNQYKESKT